MVDLGVGNWNCGAKFLALDTKNLPNHVPVYMYFLFLPRL